MSDPALADVTGKYFYFHRPGDRREKPSSPESYDPAKARDLRETSERLIVKKLAGFQN